MTGLVESLVDVQVLEEGRHVLRWGGADFSVLVEQVAAEFAKGAEREHLRSRIWTEVPAMPQWSDGSSMRQGWPV